MSAYWYLFFVTGVKLEVSEEIFSKNQEDPFFLPESYRNNFQLIEKEAYIKISPPLPDGHTLKWEKVALEYSLQEELWNPAKPFIVDTWETIKNFDKPERYRHFDEQIDSFIKDGFQKIEINRNSLKSLDDTFACMPENFFIRYWNVPLYAVFRIWPEEFGKNSEIYELNGFTLFTSYEKMDVILEDFILLNDLKNEIVKQLKDKYIFTKYLYIMGY